MKISKKYLKKIINEETKKVLFEMDNARKNLLHKHFINLYKAYTNSSKKYNSNFTVVGQEYDHKKVLEDIKNETGMSASDLYDELLSDFEGEIDGNMFSIIRGILTDAMLDDDKDVYIGKRDKEDIEKGLYDRYKHYHGKPDIRLSDSEEN